MAQSHLQPHIERVSPQLMVFGVLMFGNFRPCGGPYQFAQNLEALAPSVTAFGFVNIDGLVVTLGGGSTTPNTIDFARFLSVAIGTFSKNGIACRLH